MVQPAIEDAILKSDVCIVLWTRSYALSPWCNDELDLALQRESAGAVKIWLFNLDGTDIVPRLARRLPQAVVRKPEALIDAVAALLQSSA
jgi:TIR domain